MVQIHILECLALTPGREAERLVQGWVISQKLLNPS
jgi:hypothetical protein